MALQNSIKSDTAIMALSAILRICQVRHEEIGFPGGLPAAPTKSCLNLSLMLGEQRSFIDRDVERFPNTFFPIALDLHLSFKLSKFFENCLAILDIEIAPEPLGQRL